MTYSGYVVVMEQDSHDRAKNERATALLIGAGLVRARLGIGQTVVFARPSLLNATHLPPLLGAGWRAGFCGITDIAVHGDCDTGDAGAWPLGRTGSKGPSLWTIEACVERCERCARCRFATLSLREGDCSWSRECTLDASMPALAHHTLHASAS